MSQEVWGWIAISAMQLLTALVTLHTRAEVRKQSQNIQKIETATNSMKDALVASTAQASQALGELKGRADQKAGL
jgi:hypothetical protein